jgi:cell division septation protein DedD
MLGIYDHKEAESVERSEPIDDTREDVAAEIETEDYEIVVGRRQLASISFVVLVLIAIFCTVAYLAGKSLAPKVASAPAPQVVAPPPAAPVIPQIEATIAPIPTGPVPQPIQALVKADLNDPPIFSNPTPGAVYIQVGAVEKGVAAIFAAGLRGNGLESFVAPGPSEKIFRVLIGPLPDPAAYQRAKEKLDQLGLNTFGKRVENPPPASK